MISKEYYKDRPAVKIADDTIECMFLPEDGAKLVSLKTKDGRELLAQARSKEYKRLFLDSNYIDSECSAFDDMFPTIDPCTINELDYLDHGEVCRCEHKCTINNDSVNFECILPKLNIVFSKNVCVEDGTLYVKYAINNLNNFEFPYIWAGHMMFAGEEDAFVTSDFSGDSEIKVMFGNPTHRNEINKLQTYGNKQYKYYYVEKKNPLSCGIIYPNSNLKVLVDFDGDAVKHLGVWMNPGDLNEMYNIALEPCTALYDSPINAASAGDISVLAAHETVEFTLKIRYEEI